MPLQQACPVAPHALQVPAVQIAPGPVQVVPVPPSTAPQQGWVAAPQAVVPFWQEPAVHMPLVPEPVQVAPAAVQVPLLAPMQQPPLLQTRAAQQG